jgi:2-(1,2-epoxy-1,2-dihydrophenyl)acetyl-CoA isomerase
VADEVHYEVADAVATITLDRPQALNALTRDMKDALLAAVVRASEDTAVRAVLLTGTGRAFCVGQDLAEHAASLDAGDASLAHTVEQHYNPTVLAISRMPKPVIAAVNGVAAGAGAALAFAADLRIVADTATFSMAFSKIGLVPDTGSSWTLQRLIGYGKAAELLLLGTSINAEEALRLGLVTRMVPAGQLADQATTLARELAAGPTIGYALTKQALEFASWHGLAESVAKEAELQGMAGRTGDHRAATAAFVDKQRPTFRGE